MTPLLPGEHVGQELEGELDVVELLLEAGQPLLDQVLGSQSEVSIVEAGPITAHLAAVHVRHDLVHGVLGLQTVDIRTMGMNKDKRTLKGKTTQTSGIYTAVGYLK